MLINEILDLSRVEAGRYDLREESIDLRAMIDECVHLVTLRASKKDIAIQLEHAEILDRPLGGRTGGAPGRAQSFVERDQVYAAGRSRRHPARHHGLRRPVLLDRRHGRRHPGERDPDRDVVVRTRRPGAQDSRGRHWARAADRQGPRRIAWRPLRTVLAGCARARPSPSRSRRSG